MKKSVSVILVLCVIASSLALSFGAFASGDEVAKAAEAVVALTADKTTIKTKAPNDAAKL